MEKKYEETNKPVGQNTDREEASHSDIYARADEWMNEPVYLGVILKCKAKDLLLIKDWLNEQAFLKVCHLRTSAGYMYIYNIKPKECEYKPEEVL